MRINKIVLNSIFIMGFVLMVQGQNQDIKKDNASIHAVILSLFDGMREADMSSATVEWMLLTWSRTTQATGKSSI